jgi:hypothetical protein
MYTFPRNKHLFEIPSNSTCAKRQEMAEIHRDQEIPKVLSDWAKRHATKACLPQVLCDSKIGFLVNINLTVNSKNQSFLMKKRNKRMRLCVFFFFF